MASLLLPVIYLAFIGLGLPDSVLGSVWPVLHNVVGTASSNAGFVSFTISICTVVSSLMSDRLTRRFGPGKVTAFSTLLTSFALLCFSRCTRLWHLIVFAVPYGLGAGSVDSALNNYVAIHYKSRHMSWLHCMWGVGTAIGPVVMGQALALSTWKTGYVILSCLQLCIALAVFATLPKWKMSGEEPEKGRPAAIRETVGQNGVPFMMLLFLCYCALESTCMLWGSTYLLDVTSIDTVTAARFASMFCLGITAGRFASGFLAFKFGDFQMVRLGQAVIMVSAVCLVLFPSLSAIWLLLAGLGCAPIYPSAMHSIPGLFGTERSQSVIGVVMASAYVGSSCFPPIAGLLMKRFGTGVLPYFLLVLLACMVFCAECCKKSQ